MNESPSPSGSQPARSNREETFLASKPLTMLSEAEQMQLFDDVCGAGGKDPELMKRLQEVLRSTPGAAENYLDYAAMHADLYGAVRLARVHELVAAEVETLDEESTQLSINEAIPRSRTSSKVSLAQLAAWSSPLIAVAASLFFLLPYLIESPPATNTSTGTNANTTDLAASSPSDPLQGNVAIRGPSPEASEVWVAAVAKVNYSDVESGAFQTGSMLQTGDTVEFDAGRMEIEFQQGAVVALEGPAAFTISSRNSGQLLAGRLAAVVPPWADGFCIDTAKLQVIDRGTSFAISVDDQQDVAVTVTKGEVEVISPESQFGQRVLAGKTVHANEVGVRAAKVDASLVSLTKRLPDRPDGSDVEVVGRYQHDWISGIPGKPRRAGPWRYYTNVKEKIGNPKAYQELLWDPRGVGCYDADGISKPFREGLSIIKLRQGSGHPGHGTRQTPNGISHYAIAAFTIPEDGIYRIESGWIFRPENQPLDQSRPWSAKQSIDVVVHVDSDEPVITAKCRRDGFLKFGGPIGGLRAGATVYVGVGPGQYNFNDRFEWGFFIVRELETTIDPSI